MVKKFIPTIAVILLLGSCSSLKQLSISNNKQIVPQSSANNNTAQIAPVQKTNDVKFLNTISADAQNTSPEISNKTTKQVTREEVVTPKVVEENYSATDNTDKISETTIADNSAMLQTKYAMMLNTDASRLQNVKLYEYIDNWYGTPYKFGGTSKDGIDCSAFVQSLFVAVYGINLPRTSKYQYTATKRISTTQLKEGDLLFFHTLRYHRGVTHVGIYLQNNKFVQASSSGGVEISDMYEPYYAQHLIGAGRVAGGDK